MLRLQARLRRISDSWPSLPSRVDSSKLEDNVEWTKQVWASELVFLVEWSDHSSQWTLERRWMRALRALREAQNVAQMAIARDRVCARQLGSESMNTGWTLSTGLAWTQWTEQKEWGQRATSKRVTRNTGQQCGAEGMQEAVSSAAIANQIVVRHCQWELEGSSRSRLHREQHTPNRLVISYWHKFIHRIANLRSMWCQMFGSGRSSGPNTCM